MSDPSALQALSWIAVALAAALGLAIGLAIGRRSGREARERVHDLEERLQIAEEDMTRYRSHVSGHFAETSKLLRDLTLQYRSVYEHLAEGARTLCADGAQLLAPSLAEAALPADAGERSDGPAPDEAQLNLGLQPSGRWAAGEEAAALEPILDEQIETVPAPADEETQRQG